METNDRVLRIKAVLGKTGLSRATIYREINANRFPKPKKIGPRAVGWPESAINRWLESRPYSGAGA